MSKRKERQIEFEWKTKQSRMLADLYKTFYDVLDTNNLYGKIEVETLMNNHMPTISVTVANRDYEGLTIEYHEAITMSREESYSNWVNRIIEFKSKLEKFGKEY